MKLLTYPSKKKAKPVTSWRDIREAAFDMLELLNTGKFPRLWQEGFALSHAQVSDDPFDFFVTHKSFEGLLPRVVCNARVVAHWDTETFKEGCLSFPHRQVIKTSRYWGISVEYDVPPIDGIRSLLGLNRLNKEEQSFDGLVSFMFQHEIDHAKGIDIYHK